MLRLQRLGFLSILVAIAVLFVIDGAQSQRHPKQGSQPVPVQGQYEPQSKPQQPQQAPASDQRGTEQAPFVVKMIPAPASHEDTPGEEAKRYEEKAELDRKMVKFNGDVANYTLILAIVAVFQFLALFVQAVFLAKTFKVARTALRDLERALIFGSTTLHGLDENGKMILMPQCINYGRSFALLQEIRIGTSDQEPISKIPDYSKLESHRYDLVIQPNVPMTDRRYTITHSSE